MSGWVKHFGLSSDPFADDPHTWQYYYGAQYGPASLRLERALEQHGGYVLVTGPAGTGKSALVRSVLRRASVYASATVSVAQRAPVAVLDALLIGREPLENEFSATRKRAALFDMLDKARKSARPIVCVVEDAHLANSGQLRELVEAINVAPDAPQILQVILVGRPELARTLQARTVAALATRITTRIETTRLKDEEIAEYLLDRLAHAEAEYPAAILPPSGATAIARHSRGIIALAETLARSALERAAAARSTSVAGEVIDEAAQIYAQPFDERIAWTQRAPASVSAMFKSGPAVALVMLALLVAGAQIRMVGTTGESGPGQARAQMAGMGELVQLRPLPVPEKRHYELRAPVRVAQANSALREKFLEGTPYEVQIKPPQRPDATDAPAAAEAAAKPAAKAAAAASDSKAGPSKTEAAPTALRAPMDAVRSTSAPGPAGTPKPPPASANVRASAPAPGGTYALQVGAFRELRSAIAQKDRLARSFSNVYVSTVESGGEPLYRIRVGSFKRPEDTLPLKMELQAAGYASFRVSEDAK